MGHELFNDHVAYSVVSGLAWHAAIVAFAFAFELTFYFRESERSVANLFLVLLLCFKGALIAWQGWRLCRGQIKNDVLRSVGRIQLVVLILFSVSDIVAISVVNVPQTALIFITVSAALLHLLAASMDRRSRMDALRQLRSQAGVGWLSATLDAAVVASSFIWAAAAVAAETGERDLEIALLIFLGLGAAVVVLGTAILARILNGVAKESGLGQHQWLPPLVLRVDLRDGEWNLGGE